MLQSRSMRGVGGLGREWWPQRVDREIQNVQLTKGGRAARRLQSLHTLCSSWFPPSWKCSCFSFLPLFAMVIASFLIFAIMKAIFILKDISASLFHIEISSKLPLFKSFFSSLPPLSPQELWLGGRRTRNLCMAWMSMEVKSFKSFYFLFQN